jgi:hypothetical protein
LSFPDPVREPGGNMEESTSAIRSKDSTSPAWWQSGYAADCKSAYAGSIPTQASSTTKPDRKVGLFVCGFVRARGIA